VTYLIQGRDKFFLPVDAAIQILYQKINKTMLILHPSTRTYLLKFPNLGGVLQHAAGHQCSGMSRGRKVGYADLKFLDSVQIKATLCREFITCSRDLILAPD
jgi:hypothetical protein